MPQDLWLWNFDNNPIFKITILRKEIFFSPDRCSKGVRFAKNDRLDVLIVLAKMSNFYYSLENDPKGGTLGDFLHFCTGWKLKILNFLLVSHLFSSEYDFPTTQKRFLCISKHIKCLFKYYVTNINIQHTTGVMLYYGKTITIKWKRKDLGGPVKSRKA